MLLLFSLEIIEREREREGWQQRPNKIQEMTETVIITRPSTEVPFGFKLQGGADFSTPLSILSVAPGSVADLAGLRAGDAIVKINDMDTSWMEHSRAKTEIVRCGNDFRLTIRR